MKMVSPIRVALVLLCLGSSAQANVLNLGTGYTSLETIAIGDPGNTPDLRYSSVGFGSVSYSYDIGKYEVTAAQYCDFLNNKAKSDPYGLWNSSMDTANNTYGCNIKRSGISGGYTYGVANDWANRPVNFVSFWDACRFTNWLDNGQGNGDTETGAYDLDGYTGQDGRAIRRNDGCTWAVTSHDEWYKAAYYDPDKAGGAGYWRYPTRGDTAPSLASSDGYTDPGNSANYVGDTGHSTAPYYRTNVGEFEKSASAYGTFDQGGNVWEWNEAIVWQTADFASRGVRGGAWDTGDYLRAYYYFNSYVMYPSQEGSDLGFRVSHVPEPSSIIALLGGLVAFVGSRRRRA